MESMTRFIFAPAPTAAATLGKGVGSEMGLQNGMSQAMTNVKRPRISFAGAPYE